MKAKYVGKDSQDFINGHTYELTSEITEARIGGGAMGKTVPCIMLYDKNGSGYCSYGSVEAMIEDWVFMKG